MKLVKTSEEEHLSKVDARLDLGIALGILNGSAQGRWVRAYSRCGRRRNLHRDGIWYPFPEGNRTAYLSTEDQYALARASLMISFQCDSATDLDHNPSMVVGKWYQNAASVTCQSDYVFNPLSSILTWFSRGSLNSQITNCSGLDGRFK